MTSDLGDTVGKTPRIEHRQVSDLGILSVMAIFTSHALTLRFWPRPGKL